MRLSRCGNQVASPMVPSSVNFWRCYNVAGERNFFNYIRPDAGDGAIGRRNSVGHVL